MATTEGPRLLDLPNGKQTVIDEEDFERVRDLTLYVGANGYVYFSVWKDGRSIPKTLHGFLMQPARGMHTDHINGDKLDNRRSNLRVVSPSINQVNRRWLNRNNTSGVRGVRWNPECRKWQAQIMASRKAIYLGVFERIEDAIAARKAAEVELFGEACP